MLVIFRFIFSGVYDFAKFLCLLDFALHAPRFSLSSRGVGSPQKIDAGAQIASAPKRMDESHLKKK